MVGCEVVRKLLKNASMENSQTMGDGGRVKEREHLAGEAVLRQ
jgi:hypothetical protein